MFEPCFITSFLCGTIATTGVSAQEYVKNYCKVAIRRHKQSFPRVAVADVIAAVNLTTSRLLRLDAKLWGQIEGGSFVWLVTSEEWKQFSDSLHSKEDAPMRYGKRFQYKNPSYLSSQQLSDFIAVFCSLYKFNIDKSAALNVQKQDVCSPNVMNAIFDKNIATPVEPIFQASPAPSTPASAISPSSPIKRPSISSTNSPYRRRSSKSPRNSFQWQDPSPGYVAKHEMMSPNRRSLGHSKVTSSSGSSERSVSPKKDDSPLSRGASSPSALTKLFPVETAEESEQKAQEVDTYSSLEALHSAEDAGVQTYGSLRIALGSEYSSASHSGHSTPSKSVRSSITTETTETSDSPVRSLQSYIDSALRANALTSATSIPLHQQYWDPAIHDEPDMPPVTSGASTPTECDSDPDLQLLNAEPDDVPLLVSEESADSQTRTAGSSEVLLGDDDCPAMEKEEVASISATTEPLIHSTYARDENIASVPQVKSTQVNVEANITQSDIENIQGEVVESEEPIAPEDMRSPVLSSESSPIMMEAITDLNSDIVQENESKLDNDAPTDDVVEGAHLPNDLTVTDVTEAANIDALTSSESPRETTDGNIDNELGIAVDNTSKIRSVYASDDIAASVPPKSSARKPTRASYTEGDERKLTPRGKGASTLLSAIESLRKEKSEKMKSPRAMEKEDKNVTIVGKSVIPLLFPRQSPSPRLGCDSELTSPRESGERATMSATYCFIKGGVWTSRLILENDEFYRRLLKSRYAPEQVEEAVMHALMNVHDSDGLESSRSNVDSLAYSSAPEETSPRQAAATESTKMEQLRQDNADLRTKIDLLSASIDSLTKQVQELHSFVPPSPPHLRTLTSLESVESVHPFDSENDVHESPKKHRSKSMYSSGRKSSDSSRRKRRESFREFTPHISLKLDDIVEETGDGSRSPDNTSMTGIALPAVVAEPAVRRVDQSVSPIPLIQEHREMRDQATMTEYEITVRSRKISDVAQVDPAHACESNYIDDSQHADQMIRDEPSPSINVPANDTSVDVISRVEQPPAEEKGVATMSLQDETTPIEISKEPVDFDKIDSNEEIGDPVPVDQMEPGAMKSELRDLPETPSKATRSVQFFDAPSPISDTQSIKEVDIDMVVPIIGKVMQEESNYVTNSPVVRTFLPFLLAFEWQEAKQLLQKQQTVAALSDPALAEIASKAAMVTQSFQHEMQQRIVACVVRKEQMSKGDDGIMFRRKYILWAAFQYYAKAECSVARYITYDVILAMFDVIHDRSTQIKKLLSDTGLFKQKGSTNGLTSEKLGLELQRLVGIEKNSYKHAVQYGGKVCNTRFGRTVSIVNASANSSLILSFASFLRLMEILLPFLEAAPANDDLCAEEWLIAKLDTMLQQITVQSMVPSAALFPHEVSVIERHSDVMRLWYKNAEQVRQLYDYYAITVEQPLSECSPHIVELMSFDNCKSLLQDFNVFPAIVDHKTYLWIYRQAKQWEWCVGANDWEADVPDSSSVSVSSPSKRALLSNNVKVSMGSLCITLRGLIEVLTRISLLLPLPREAPGKSNSNGKLVALSTLLRLMDGSKGKQKLIDSSRKSTCIRKFLYK